MIPTLDLVAVNVRMLRSAARMTQKELAAKAGLATGSISDLECHRRPLSVRSLYRIAAALQVDIYEIFRKRPEHDKYEKADEEDA